MFDIAIKTALGCKRSEGNVYFIDLVQGDIFPRKTKFSYP